MRKSCKKRAHFRREDNIYSYKSITSTIRSNLLSDNTLYLGKKILSLCCHYNASLIISCDNKKLFGDNNKKLLMTKNNILLLKAKI